MRAWPWRLLDIDATSDRKTIRSAYAAKLKSGDFDEADAFAQLRAARDQALYIADSGDFPADDPTVGLDDPYEETAPPPPSPSAPLIASDVIGISAGHIPPADTSSPLITSEFSHDHGAGAAIGAPHASITAPQVEGHAEHDTIGTDERLTDLQQLCREVYHLLENDAPEVLLTEAEHGTLRDTLSRAIAMASDQGIDSQSDFEIWLAELIARTAPRSDPALELASAAYDWAARSRTVDAPPVIAWLGERQAAGAFLTQLENPKHRWHRAYRELTTPANEGSRRGFWVKSRNVRDLMLYTRANYPGVEQTFDPWRVSLWEGTTGKEGTGWTGITIVVVIVLLNIGRVFNDGGSTNPPPTSVPVQVSAPVALTLDQALEPIVATFDAPEFTIAALEKNNPALFAELEQRWKDAKDSQQPAYAFEGDAKRLLAERAELALATASYAISRERVTALRKATAKFAAEHPRYCVDFLNGKTMTDEWLTEYRASYRHVMALALLERDTPPHLPARNGSFIIPGAVMQDIGERTHLPRTAVDSALGGKNPDEDQTCRVRMALMDAALAAPPKVGLPLLRGL